MKAARVAFFLVLFLGLLGATVVLASEGGHGESPWDTTKLVWRVVNTIALVVLLVYFLKPPLVTFFSERSDQIRRDLEEARAQRDKAEQLIREYEAKLAGMEKQVESMRADLAQSAAAEGTKVVANADQMAEKLVVAARVTAEQEVRKAKIALKNEAVELAMQLAETLIREKINDDDRARIVEDYLAKVGGMK
jgi:F-type H+-transporting ATPase subunit b